MVVLVLCIRLVVVVVAGLGLHLGLPMEFLLLAAAPELLLEVLLSLLLVFLDKRAP